MPGDEAPIVYLLDGPTVSVASVRHPVPDGSRRLVALLALDRRCLDRRFIAGTLWPETDEGHAAGCLRTALWRLRREGLDIVVVGKTALQLRSDARVDVEEEELEWASRIIARRESPDDLVMTERRAAGLDLLPGWYDDWVSPHRERLRQRILHALDELSHALSTAARYADAVEVAQASVACDPLRESGQRALIRAHLAEGNTAEARARIRAVRVAARPRTRAAPERRTRDLGGSLFRAIGLSPRRLDRRCMSREDAAGHRSALVQGIHLSGDIDHYGQAPDLGGQLRGNAGIQHANHNGLSPRGADAEADGGDARNGEKTCLFARRQPSDRRARLDLGRAVLDGSRTGEVRP
jgi:DNA-binding SARP family transcriptional activator